MINKFKHFKWHGVITVVFLGLFVLLSYFPLGLNKSPSLSYKIFMWNTLNKDVQVGDLVAFWAPETAYSPDGAKVKPRAVKIVLGTVGDKITTDGENVYVTKVIPLKKFSLLGRPLKGIQDVQVSEGQYFVYTPHKDSYDSRYEEIGIVSKEQIIGKAWGLWKK